MSRIHVIGTAAVTLTDDYHPVDFYDIRVKKRVRILILQGRYGYADIVLKWRLPGPKDKNTEA